MRRSGEKKEERKRKAAKEAVRGEAYSAEQLARTKLSPGDEVVVVMRYDETLPEEFLGRRGVVVGPMPYQELGDDPEVDPVYLVEHGPSTTSGRPFGTQIYWREEIQLYQNDETGTRA